MLIKKVKATASEKNLILLSLLDTSTFVGCKDATANLVLYWTGIRVHTLALLEERHINKKNTLVLTGDIMKGRMSLKLPVDDELAEKKC